MVYAIRGATTVDYDNKDEITAASKELFEAVMKKNNLADNNIISIIISTTKDITSYYPAAALRVCGLTSAPLFSCVEPDINNNLKLCIRLLITADGADKSSVKHIYLKGAKILRPDLEEDINA